MHQAVSTTNTATETIDTPFTTTRLSSLLVSLLVSLHKTIVVSSSMRRETDHPHPLRDSTFQRVRSVHQLGFRLIVVCSLFLALAAANFASDAAMLFARVSDVNLCNVILDGILCRSIVRIVAHRHICHLLDGLHLADLFTLFEVEGCGESLTPVSIVVLKFPLSAVSL